jgi:hypothetical protein
VSPAVTRAGAASLLLVMLTACGEGTVGPGATPPGRFAYHGITHVSWWHDEYLYADATASRAQLASTGADWAGVLVTWYMDRRDSVAIAPDTVKTPTDAAVRRAIDELRGRGLKVMLKPHVDVKDGTWRGTIRPAETDAWFVSYREFVTHYAALAQAAGVELYCVGTELATLTNRRYQAAWVEVIGSVRARYGGPLTYAANGVTPGDEYTSVSFWDRLDLAGLDVYPPLTGRRDPSRAELQQAWYRNRDGHDLVAAFRNWQRAHGKPVVFTEIGYRSADGTNMAPWDWQASAPVDPGEQADCYAAALEVWSRETDWMRGLFWWSWAVPVPAFGDTDFTPRGKPAEAVLRSWNDR